MCMCSPQASARIRGGGRRIAGGSGAYERLRLRLGAGQWGTLRGSSQRSPFVGLSVGYAYGVLGS